MGKPYAGQRLSFKGDLCTIRYIGPVDGKKGDFLGVEWDEVDRGKHAGTFEGKIYFTCRSSSPKCASFLKTDAKPDLTKSIDQAVREKYASLDDPTAGVTVQISGKTVEEIGYAKIASQQSKLDALRIVVLDNQRISISPGGPISQIKDICPSVTQLDLGRNLFDRLEGIVDVIRGSDHLSSLSLDGNRLSQITCSSTIASLHTLSLDRMLLSPNELYQILSVFPNISHLSASGNQLSQDAIPPLPRSLRSLQLNENGFSTLSSIAPCLKQCIELRKVSLKHNDIQRLGESTNSASNLMQFPPSIHDLDLSHNAIKSFSFIDSLTSLAPGLTDLRISHNPLYSSTVRPSGKFLDQTQVSMLITARIPHLTSLNHTPILEKDRLNAETFYLSLITEEIASAAPSDEANIIASHPRYEYLCEEYGAPTIRRDGEKSYGPNAIGARLIRCKVFFASPSGTPGSESTRAFPTSDAESMLEIPSSFSIYNLRAAIGREWKLIPSELRMRWFTGEQEIAEEKAMQSQEKMEVDEWDSEEEEVDTVQWRERVVELVPGTRRLGTLVDEGSEIRIGVEITGDGVGRVEDSIKIATGI